MLGAVAHEGEQLCMLRAAQRGRDMGANQLQLFCDRERQRRLQTASQALLLLGIEGIRASEEMQPLIALRQHGGQ